MLQRRGLPASTGAPAAVVNVDFPCAYRFNNEKACRWRESS
jgi:hypothetical protein